MRKYVVAAASLSFLLSTGAVTRAADAEDPLLTHAAPSKWYQKYLPEKLPAMSLPEYISNSATDLAEAQVFAGRYKLSLITIAKAKAGNPARIALVKGAANWSLGRYDDALAAVSDPAAAPDPRVQVLHARILADYDRQDQAVALLKTLLQAHSDSIAGHYYLGQISEDIGDYKQAREQYAWFSAPPHVFLDLWNAQSERAFDNAEELVLIARALDRGATLNSSYKDNVALNNAILNMFVKAYDVIDRGYWPARVAAAEFYLSHDNPDKALKELEKANSSNPQSVQIDRMMGELMLQYRKYTEAEQIIAGLQKTNPDSIDAEILQAELELGTGKREEGASRLERVLKLRPRRLDVIGLLAGYRTSRVQNAEADELLKKAEAIAPESPAALLEAAQLLYSCHQNKPAIELLTTAIKRAPWSTQARTLLGVLYLHSGDDEQARATLEAAYALDPYNVSTVNYLRLLDETAKFLRTETDHFIFLYAQEDDIVVPQYFAPYMESAYKGLCDEFKCEPAEKTIIQIYPDSQRFSVRVSGMPGLETFAVTFGRLIVASSPRAGENVGAFNWGRVLKHEFAHVLHIDKTEGRVPRWLTEGLAVLSEKVDYRFEWVPPVLYKRAIEHKLFKINQLNEVFVRPKAGQDGELAYMTGFWISRYLIATYGADSIDRLLIAYRDGLLDNDAFVRATGQPLSTIESGFGDWAAEQVKSWGYDTATAANYKKHYDSGETLVQQGKLDEAVKEYQEASKLQPQNPQPHRRLAGVALKEKKYDDALPHLEWLIPLELKDNRFAKRIAGIYRDADKLDQAVASGETAVIIDPYDPTAHDLLQGLYEKAGQTEKATRESEVAKILRDRKVAASKQDQPAPAKHE